VVNPRTIEQILTMLATAPTGLVDLTEGLSQTQLLVPPQPSEWFTRFMLAYLRAGDDMWGKYIAQILNADRPMIKAVNPTTRIKKTDYRQPDIQSSLQVFTTHRAEFMVFYLHLVDIYRD
jgi:hypothetical protein